MISLYFRLSGAGVGVEVFVGMQSVKLGRSGLSSVVSSFGGVLSMMVAMWLISFMMSTFASGVSY